MSQNKLSQSPAKCSCIICKKQYSSSGIHTHFVRSHEKNPRFKNSGNGGRKAGFRGVNQYIAAKRSGTPIPSMSQEARMRLSMKQKEHNATFWTAEKRHEHSEKMQKVVEASPESYSHMRGGRCKYKEHYADSSWEVYMMEYFDANEIIFERKCGYFKYTFQGKERKYFPDFFLPEYDIYVEVKGYKTDKDIAKWTQFPEKLIIIDGELIESVQDKTLPKDYWRIV